MKKLFSIAVAAIFVTTGAFAEDVATSQPPADVTAPAVSATPPVATPSKFYLEVDQNDLAAISQALAELPKRIADPLILKLNAQLQAQPQIMASKEASDKDRKKGKK